MFIIKKNNDYPKILMKDEKIQLPNVSKFDSNDFSAYTYYIHKENKYDRQNKHKPDKRKSGYENRLFLYYSFRFP